MPTPHDVSRLLARMTAGDDAAVEEVFPLVYDELRGLAANVLRAERMGHTLQPTALVHEAYLKLVDQHSAQFEDRHHFLAVAATAMRRILVDHARGRAAAKRGGGRLQLTLDDAVAVTDGDDVDLVALDAALTRLGAIDEGQARVVELRFFGGLTIDQTADLMNVSSRTVQYDWAMARAWLRGELMKDAS